MTKKELSDWEKINDDNCNPEEREEAKKSVSKRTALITAPGGAYSGAMIGSVVPVLLNKGTKKSVLTGAAIGAIGGGAGMYLHNKRRSSKKLDKITSDSSKKGERLENLSMIREEKRRRGIK